MNNGEMNLDDLPAPRVVEEVDYEQLLLERKKKLLELNPAYREVLELESSPLVADLQVGAYREYYLRKRINEAAQAGLLAKARESDLDHLGAFYGIRRDKGEEDPAFRLRIRDRILGSSTAGSAAHYKTRAMEVEPAAIRDLAIDSPEEGRVRISILVRRGYCFRRKKLIGQLDRFQCADYCPAVKPGLIPEAHACPDFVNLSQALIRKVERHVDSDSVRMLTDTVSVGASQKKVVQVEAEIHLEPTTPEIVFKTIEKAFKANWEQEAGLGRDITPSWITSQLHHPGVHHVILIKPLEISSIAPNQSAELGELNLVMKRSEEK